MQRIVARLFSPPLLWDVLAFAGLPLLIAGLWWVSAAVALAVLGVLLLAGAFIAASHDEDRQRQHDRRGRRHKSRRQAQGMGRDVISFGPVLDKGRLAGPDEDDLAL